jgi:hypothetical protein
MKPVLTVLRLNVSDKVSDRRKAKRVRKRLASLHLGFEDHMIQVDA